jgi:hypothetical protein
VAAITLLRFFMRILNIINCLTCLTLEAKIDVEISNLYKKLDRIKQGRMPLTLGSHKFLLRICGGVLVLFLSYKGFILWQAQQ